MTGSLCRNWHNTVNQLHSNKNKNEKNIVWLNMNKFASLSSPTQLPKSIFHMSFESTIHSHRDILFRKLVTSALIGIRWWFEITSLAGLLNILGFFFFLPSTFFFLFSSSHQHVVSSVVDASGVGFAENTKSAAMISFISKKINSLIYSFKIWNSLRELQNSSIFSPWTKLEESHQPITPSFSWSQHICMCVCVCPYYVPELSGC